MNAKTTNLTLDYYNTYAAEFAKRTRNVDMSAALEKFTKKLAPGALILDLGCGAGRDTKYFLEHGFRVEAIDGSEELCRLATDYTGVQVVCADFNDLTEAQKYDAVWANSSLLHLPLAKLPEIFRKIAKSLEKNGIFYSSYKYGDFEGLRNERYFTDMTKQKFLQVMKEADCFTVDEIWVTRDARPQKEAERWLNAIIKK